MVRTWYLVPGTRYRDLFTFTLYRYLVLVGLINNSLADRASQSANCVARDTVLYVFRIKRNLSVQGWVTVLNPVIMGGYPPQLLLTRDEELEVLEPTFPSALHGLSPEHRLAVARVNGDREPG